MVLHDESSYKDKKLPKGKSETEGVDTYAQPKVRSRRFPIKAMYMGVVGRPIEGENFDGNTSRKS